MALVEWREVLGGVCVNAGTIPSKTMREAVLHLSGYHYREIYGINYRIKDKITMADLVYRVQHVIKTEVDVTHLPGVHIIGEGATELLHIGQAVFSLNGTMNYFIDSLFNYPTLAECYKAAAFNGLNKLAHY